MIVDFGKYIHELLLENDIVIVPGFGAFVSEYKPAEISEGSDEIKPPSKIVTFNQQIRNNDGLLVGHVAERKRSSHFDALKKIEKEREEILYKLDNGEQVELSAVGTLFYTEEHNVGFTAVEDENLLLDSFGLEATAIAGKEEFNEKPIVEPVVEEEVKEEPELEVTAVEKENKEKAEVIVTESNLVSEPEPERKSVPESETEVVPETISPVAEPTTEEPKKKRGWWWLLLVLIPLIAVSVFLFMKGKKDGAADRQQTMEQQPIIKEEPVVVPQIDTVKTDTIQVLETDTIKTEEEKPEPVVETDPDKPKYYLVGGSFSIEENAETYLKELKAKGFDAFHVGKKGRFFIIGIGTYNTFGEADKAKKEYMTNNSGSEVWVYKK